MQHGSYLENDRWQDTTLELASLGETLAYPNPLVGALVTYQNKIVGSGFHRAYGEAHAEVIALEEAKNVLNKHAQDCYLYVNLEPCAHYGKTPPCTELIIRSGIKKVIVLSYDPNPIVAGRGVAKLEAAGITVIKPEELDIEIQEKAKFINRVFFNKVQAEKNSQAPLWLTLKIAQTSDGRMITRPNEDRWITNNESRQLVHRLRSTNELLVTSLKTIIADDPEYTVRHSPEKLGLADTKNPDLVIFTRNNTLFQKRKPKLKIFNQKFSRQVHLFPQVAAKDTARDFVNFCQKHNYQRVMIEAGPSLSQFFLESGLVNEIHHFEPQSGRCIEEFEAKLQSLYKDRRKPKLIKIKDDFLGII